jgi:hypothetical protein
MISLAIAAYRRPYYLERQFDAWTRVRGLEGVERCHVTLGWSDRRGEALAAVDRFQARVPFKVHVAEDDPPQGHNLGIGKAIGMAFDAGAGFVFFADEDILPADDTLELADWGRRMFADDWRVLTVNAHSECGQGWDGPYVQDDPYADPAAVRLKHYFNMWGWGTWRDRWEKTILPEWDWDGRHRGCDWNMQRLMRQYGRLGATPDASRTQHIGYREGMFASPETLAFSDAASFREHRDPVVFQCVS